MLSTVSPEDFLIPWNPFESANNMKIPHMKPSASSTAPIELNTKQKRLQH